jgi:tetratricopeptide (TPR) repeat protein
VQVNLQAQIKEVPITTSSNEALKLFLDGRDRSEKVEYLTAASLFDKAIQKDSSFAMAYLYRSQSIGGYNVYRQNLDKAVSLVGKVSEGEKLLILYTQASADGNGQKQKEYLDMLLASFPSDKRVQLTAGSYFFSINDFSKAHKYFSEAIKLDENYAPAYNLMGYLQSSMNNYKEAEKAFQTYIKLIPDKGDPHDSYGELLLKMGRYDESISEYRKAIEKDPVNCVGSLNGIGNNYIFKSDFESARKYFQEYFNKVPDIDGKLYALFSKATSYIYEDKIEIAANTFDEYRSLAEKENQVPYIIYSYANQAFVYTESGNPAEGLKLCDKANELIEKSNLPKADKENMRTSSMFWQVYVLISNNELGKAATELEKLKQRIESRKNPGEELGLKSMTGFFELKKGNNDKALEYFSAIKAEDPWNWYYTAVAYKNKGDSQNASKLFEKLSKFNVNSLNLALVRKRAMKELKK